ncbi:hypothetical protein J4216_06810 [Candidatus Woesearchaeota archaeon]|nr:hypothetical protein [Candidatus Woesearchaeota archaeon]
MSEEFKFKTAMYYVKNRAVSTALPKFTLQYNRLVGLLEIVKNVGNTENEFSEIYELLKDKIFSGSFKLVPDLMYDFAHLNIYNELVSAVSVLEKNHEFRDFWLENVKTNPEFYSYTFISSYKNREEKKQQIPFLLEKLKSVTDDSALDFVLRYVIAEIDRNFKAHVFDKENFSLYALNDAKIEGEHCFLNVTKYSTGQITDINCVYNVQRMEIISPEYKISHLKKLGDIFLHYQSETI